MSFELAPFDLDPDYGEGIVSLADAKAHLRVLHEAEDDLIGFYRDAAVDMVERYCGLRLGACAGLVWRAEYLCSPINLGVWPVTAVSGVAWLDSAAAPVTGDAARWRIVRRDRIQLRPGQSLPSGVAGGVEITFSAGFTAANRPPALVQAVKLFLGHVFANREAVSMGTLSGEIPLGFRMLCAAYRMPVI